MVAYVCSHPFWNQPLLDKAASHQADDRQSCSVQVMQNLRWMRKHVWDYYTTVVNRWSCVLQLTFFKEDNCKIKGPGIEEDPKGFFVIDKETKEMHVTGNANYDDRKNFTVPTLFVPLQSKLPCFLRYSAVTQLCNYRSDKEIKRNIHFIQQISRFYV